MMQHRRGQAMVEYLMVIAIAMLILVPTVIFFTSQAKTVTTEVTFTKLDSIGSSLIELIDSVYILGVDSKTTLTVNMPEGVRNISLLNYTITPYPLSNDLIINVPLSGFNSSLLFVSTYPFFFGNCTSGVTSLPYEFYQSVGKKTFELTSCGGAVAVWYT